MTDSLYLIEQMMAQAIPYPDDILQMCVYWSGAELAEIVQVLDRKVEDTLDPRQDLADLTIWQWWVACVMASADLGDVDRCYQHYTTNKPGREGCQIRRQLAHGRVPELWIERGLEVDTTSNTPADENGETLAPESPLPPSRDEHLRSAGYVVHDFADLRWWLRRPGLSEADQELRRGRLTATGAAVCAGHSPWDPSGIELYRNKVDGYAKPDNESMAMGRLLEPVVLHRYLQDLDSSGTTYHLRYGIGTVAHGNLDWLAASPDAIVERPDEIRLVQIKTSSSRWTEVPMHIVDQVHIEWEVMRSTSWGCLPVVHVPVIYGDYGLHYELHEVEIDQGYLAQLLERCSEWWHRHVVARVPPDVDVTDRAQVALRWPHATSEAMLQGTERDEAIVARLRRLRDNKRKNKEVTDTLKAMLQARIGEATGIELVDGKVTWKENKNGSRVLLWR